jgi:hypothetical protein
MLSAQPALASKAVGFRVSACPAQGQLGTKFLCEYKLLIIILLILWLPSANPFARVGLQHLEPGLGSGARIKKAGAAAL